MKKIKLTQGKFALVDDEDFEMLNKYKWHALKEGRYYARGWIKEKREKQKMHVFIMKTPKGMETDHIDGNGLNNQRKNLRICTSSQNKMNRGKQANNKSEFKGVSWVKSRNKWLAQICFNKKHINLGRFLTKELAYQAYCEACVKYHGNFARLK